MRALALLLLACSGPPEVVAPPPHCVDDGIWIANWSCVVSCANEPGAYAFGSCDQPGEQTTCVKYYRGDVVGTVRQSDRPPSVPADFTNERCE